MQGSRKNTRVLILNYQRHVQTIHKRKYINDKLEKKKKLAPLGKDGAVNTFI